MAHGSRLRAHASRLMAQGSLLMAKKKLALGPPGPGTSAMSHEPWALISLIRWSNLVYSNSQIRIPRGSKKSEDHEHRSFQDYDPSNLDLTSAPWSRIMPSRFGKCLFNIFSIKINRKWPKHALIIFPCCHALLRLHYFRAPSPHSTTLSPFCET